MFGLFSSQNKKMRDTARNWISMAEKVWAYRRDVIDEPERRELQSRTEALRAKVRAKADAADLKLAIDALEPILSRLGGKIYPKTSMIDNVEFFLVAAIVILGLRTYVVQPFKIPTNSMWPSYYGMTADNLLVKHENPTGIERLARLLAFGAMRYEVSAPQSGDVSAKFYGNGLMAYTLVRGHKWLILPTTLKEYTFYVNGAETKVDVPEDFNEFDDVVEQTLFGSKAGFQKTFEDAARNHQLEASYVPVGVGSDEARRAYLLHTGRTVAQGAPVLRFDLLTGDQLFVDRMSYNFVEPHVGSGFVFRTDHIPQIGRQDYFIKRLVGVPGDKLQIKAPVLWRNGAPITGAEAFDKEAKRIDSYPGYSDATTYGWDYLRRGQVMTVPQNKFFAMGDNSANSLDGRYWGFVPAKDVVGRPLFIYYPLTKRWGFAH